MTGIDRAEVNSLLCSDVMEGYLYTDSRLGFDRRRRSSVFVTPAGSHMARQLYVVSVRCKHALSAMEPFRPTSHKQNKSLSSLRPTVPLTPARGKIFVASN